MTATEIAAAILSLQSKDELKEVQRALNFRWKILTETANKKAVSQLKIGTNVSFEGKRGTIHGKVEKINRKTVIVSTMAGKWRVSPSLLKAA